METIAIWSFGAAGISALVALIFTLNKGFKAFGSAVMSGIVAGLLEWAFLYFGMPNFAHWSSLGNFGTFVIVFGVATFMAYAFNYEEYGSSFTLANTLSSITGVVFFVALIVSACVVPPAVIDNAVWDDIASLADVRDATQADQELAAADSDLLRVSPAAANLQAKGEMPGDVGSYAQVGNSFEQTVAGQQVYITDLHVSGDGWRAFRNNGSALPGYFIRSAKDVDAQTTFVGGHTLRYVPAARFSEDLQRHVYLNYILGCACEVEHLEVLEVDDDNNPVYTGTVWEYSIGNVGMVATKVIVVDPTTGSIEEFPIDEAPEWIDRIYSLEKMEERIKWWATYSEWDSEFLISDTTGKMKVDSAEDVYGADGKLEYMITVTSVGSDQTLKYDMRIDPRTGEVIKFNASGKTLSAVDDLIDEQTYTEKINTALGAEPIECERQRLLGQWTYYCILQSRSDGEGSSGSMVGYAFLQERFTSAPNMVIVADTFAQAWNELRSQIASGSGDADVQGEAADKIVVRGEILHKADQPTSGMVLFIVATRSNPEGIYFRASEDNQILSLTQVGHEVELVAFDLRVDQVNDVLAIVNLSLPPFTPSP